MTGDKHIQVLFVAGSMRSGSTLLGMMFARLEHFVHVGEIKWFWSAALKDRPLCGCGAIVRHCPFWGQVVTRVQQQGIDIAKIESLFRRFSRTVHLPAMLFRRHAKIGLAGWQTFVRATESLYAAVSDLSNGAMIVDGSKLPSHLLLLQEIASIDLRVIHLVRDGRGVAHSWDKRWRSRKGSMLRKYRLGTRSAYAAILIWMLQNFLFDRMLRHEPRQAVLRYEDLIRAPETAIKTVFNKVMLEAHFDVLNTGQELALPVTHSIGGSNQVRFANPSRALSVDDAWRFEMTPMKQRLLRMISRPSLRRFGYLV